MLAWLPKLSSKLKYRFVSLAIARGAVAFRAFALGNASLFSRFKKSTSKKASSSIGRAAVSKTAGWGFDSLLACHLKAGEVGGPLGPIN